MLGISDSTTSGDADAAATDAGPDAPDAGPRFCDTVLPKPDICSDFDEDGVTVQANFDNAKVSPDPGVAGGAKMTLDQALFTSPSRSAKMTAPTILAGRNASAYLTKFFDAPRANVDVTFDVNIVTEDLSSGGHITLFSIDFGTAGTIFVYRDQVGPAVAVFDNNTPTVTDFSRPFPTGTWKTIHAFYVSKSADGGQTGEFLVQLDNLDVIDVYVPASYATAKPTVSIGPVVTGPTGPYQVNYDNIRVSTF